MYGICNLSIVPCRAEPSDKSEMVNQLLFGEHFQVLEIKGNWAHIRCAYDNYEGWIDKKQCMTVSEETFNELQEIPVPVSLDLVQVITNKETNTVMPIVMGSSLPLFDVDACNLEGHEFFFDGHCFMPSKIIQKEKVAEHAYSYLNAPYLWGGRSPLGIDCSGFTQVVHKLCGIKIPRDASQQAQLGQTLSFVEEAEEGDLAFFDNEEGRITHVGIYLPNNQIIHASGKVRIDHLDHYGIYNTETQSYSHNLRIIKRIVS